MSSRGRKVASVFRFAGGLAGFGGSLIYCAARLVVGRRAELAHDVARVMSRLTLGGGRVFVDVRDGERLETSRPCVFVANHQSYLDYPVLATVFPKGTVVVAKREISRIPVIGTLFRLAGQPMIDRDDPARARETINALGEAINRDGISVGMFPEGTRNRRSGTLLPFKSGAFHLAVNAQVPVVPVVVSPLRPLFDLERGVVAGRRVVLSVLAAEPPGLDVATLRERVRERMLAALRLSETT